MEAYHADKIIERLEAIYAQIAELNSKITGPGEQAQNNNTRAEAQRK